MEMDEKLKAANILSRAGKMQEARKLLEQLINENPDSEAVWQSYLNTFPTEYERIGLLEVLQKSYPDNMILKNLYQKMSQSQGMGKVIVKPQKQAVSMKKVNGSQAAPGKNFRTAFYLLLIGCLLGLVIIIGVGVVFINNQPYETADELYKENVDLKKEQDDLLKQHKQLAEAYEKLQGEYGDLEALHAKLGEDYNGLADEYAALLTSYNILESEKNTLSAQYAELQETSDDLSEAFTSFRTQEVNPPYLQVAHDVAYYGFEKTNQVLIVWELPFKYLVDDIDRGYSARGSSNIPVVELSRDEDSEDFYTVYDYRQFVEPDLFKDAVDDLYYEYGGGRDTVRELWNVVAQLPRRSTAITENPRYPLETLFAGGGDGEDLAILFASLVKALPVRWTVSLVYMDINNPNDPETINHLIVFVNTGKEKFLIDPSSATDMQPYGEKGVDGWYLELE